MNRVTFTDTQLAGVALVIFTLVIVAIGPLITLWGWNQLFGDIKYLEYSLGNWVGVLIMGMFFRGVKIEKTK
jgi:hypothetical protein